MKEIPLWAVADCLHYSSVDLHSWAAELRNRGIRPLNGKEHYELMAKQLIEHLDNHGLKIDWIIK